jgi:hypothetical protein
MEMAFKDGNGNSIAATCDICGKDMYIPMNRDSELVEVSFTLNPSQPFDKGYIHRQFYKDGGIFISHACDRCRLCMTGTVWDWLAEAEYQRELASKHSARSGT